MMTAAPVDFAESAAGCAEQAAVAVHHRRRGAALEEAIHNAVFDELTEVGYAAFTIESVATRARTGKASIYRRWPTKQELVLDAVCARFGSAMDLVETSLDDTATTRDVLVQVGARLRDVAREAAEAFRATACAISRDAELAAMMDEQVRCQKRDALRDVLQRGVARGEVRPDAPFELLLDVIPAMIMYRLILQNEDISDDLLLSVVDDVAMPLLRPV